MKKIFFCSRGVLVLAVIFFMLGILAILNSIGFYGTRDVMPGSFLFAGLHAALAIFLIALGVGSVLCRRWAWYLVLWVSAMAAFVVLASGVMTVALHGFSWFIVAQIILLAYFCWLPVTFFMTRDPVKAQFFKA